MAEHTLRPDQIHHKWDNSLPPAIEIEPGDIVHCETAEVTNNQVTPGCDASVLTNLDFDQLYYSVKHESLDTNVSVSCGHWRW